MSYIKITISHKLVSKKWWLLILFPIFIGLIWGSYQQIINKQYTQYNIGIVDLDQTIQSAELIGRLSNHPSLKVIAFDNKSRAEKALAKKKILQTYIIHDGFEASIRQGDYRHVVEVISMIKSPYSDWLNDQISVGVIREWLISDGYLRLQALSPTYTREAYEKAFDSYYENNELLAFKVINSSIEDTDIPSMSQSNDFYFVWLWLLYSLIFILLLLRRWHGEWHRGIWNRLYLSGVKCYQYYLGYIFELVLLSVLGGGLSLLGSIIIGANTGISYSHLMLGLLCMLLLQFLFGSYLARLSLNLNQFTLVYSGIYISWLLLSSKYIQLLPLGEWLQYLSPLTFFIKICV